MSVRNANAAIPSALQGGASKKRKLETTWFGNYAKARADALLAELEAKGAELTAKLTRARADGEAAAHAHAEEVAALKAKLDREKRVAKRYQRERDLARAERDAASSERDAVVQERDEAARQAAAELERCKASANEAVAKAEEERLAVVKERDDSRHAVLLLDRVKGELAKKLVDATKGRDNYKGNYLDVRADFLDLVDKLEDATKERDEFEEKYKSYKKETLNRDKKLTEALEQCKTARELGRREAAADAAAATARADSAVASLQAELAKSKSLEEENENLKKQLGTAKERLGQIAAFQRRQARMRAMMMNSGFMSLGDAAFPVVPADEQQQEQVVLTVD